MASSVRFLYVLQFSVLHDTGIALVIASTEREAKTILQNSGQYNRGRGEYKVQRICCLGEYQSCEYGLVMESYTDAMVAYDALVSVVDDIKGEKGDKGDPGEQGEPGPPGSDADVTAENIERALGYVPQEELVSGDNIKTINNTSILGSGDISVSAENAVLYVEQTLTSEEKERARENIGAGTSNFSGSYDDLTDKPTIPDAQIQSDWEQSDNAKADYIKNKPSIPAAQVNSDWNAVSGVAHILNKPTIPDVSGKADKVSGGTENNFAALDSNGNFKDSGHKHSDYLTSFTETDPIFSASAAAGIDSDDITNWNGKTSNIGTITSVKMNGNTVSSSGEADLGTVITSHQDISGKADDNAVVHNTGNETVAGDKSFSDYVAINGSIGTSNDDDYPTGFGWILDYNDVSLQNVLDGKVSSVVQGGTTYSPVYGVVTLPALPFGTYIGTGTNWGSTATTCYLRTNYFSGGVIPQKEGDLVYSTGTRNLHRCGAVTWDSGQNCYKTTPTFVCYVSGFDGNYSSLSNKPTTLSGYGITDAKIESGTITLGSNTITPLTSFTETDPTVPSWAKESSKPSYTLDEVTDGSTRKLANYVSKAGDTMSGNLTMGANSVVYTTADATTWDTTQNSGLRILNSIGSAVTGAPARYYTGLSVWGGYGFQLASSSNSNTLKFRSSATAAGTYSDWVTLYHSGNCNKSDVPWTCSTLTTNGNVSVTGNITATGTITPGSDSRIKNNQKDISSENAFSVIENLKPKTWVWNERSNERLTGKSDAGLVAQEVKEILPDAVTISENGDIKDFHSLNYNTIQGYEIAAIKGLIEEVKSLKAEIVELKAQIAK